MTDKISTLGKLKESDWKSMSVKEEIRRNLKRKMSSKEPLFPGILGYENSVIPQIQHALLGKHDLLLLGLRGQAKTRILRILVDFLDDELPIVAGSEINDDPYRPISKFAKKLIEEHGDETPIEWIGREQRYGEKLATPDTTVADLVGDLDPIKAASKRLTLADEEVINFGLIPRVNRGIFVINELPDLQPRIQVALLNIMQERDIQIRGFNIRIPLDLFMCFSANPEDYTNRGNIITPLKDRIDAQIITHYPKTLEIAKKIANQEAWVNREGMTIHIPEVYRQILAQVAFEARESEYIDQKSGVSARLTITALEQVVSAAERRMVMNDEKNSSLRIADLYHMVPALTGKLELVYEGEQEGAVNVAKHLLGKAINKTFKTLMPDPQRKKGSEQQENPYKQILDWFSAGNTLDLPDDLTEKEYKKRLDGVNGLGLLVKNVKELQNEDIHSVKDLVIEALHQNSMLGKDDLDDQRSYSDMLGSMLGGMGSFDDESYPDID